LALWEAQAGADELARDNDLRADPYLASRRQALFLTPEMKRQREGRIDEAMTIASEKNLKGISRRNPLPGAKRLAELGPPDQRDALVEGYHLAMRTLSANIHVTEASFRDPRAVAEMEDGRLIFDDHVGESVAARHLAAVWFGLALEVVSVAASLGI